MLLVRAWEMEKGEVRMKGNGLEAGRTRGAFE